MIMTDMNFWIKYWAVNEKSQLNLMAIESRNSVILHYFDTESLIWSQIFKENLSISIAMNICKIKFSEI